MKQPVPKFIQEFKDRTNQKPSPTIESKRSQNATKQDDEDEEREDETPLVCVGSNVTEEEAEKFLKQSYGDEAEIRIEGAKKKRSLNEEEEKGMISFVFNVMYQLHMYLLLPCLHHYHF